jgi:hypothetical protein
MTKASKRDHSRSASLASRKPSGIRIVTIGVYGLKEAAFFEALQSAHVDTFCDIRGRRGVRGPDYPFANSARLQRRLSELGIRYFHFPELAPSPALRQAQAEADKQQGIARRKRTVLSETFIKGFCKEILTHFNSQEFMDSLGPEARTIALFCVERDPAACHRSLVAERLRRDLGVEVLPIVPE